MGVVHGHCIRSVHLSGQLTGITTVKMMLSIAKIIDDDVAKADKQTRDTRFDFSAQRDRDHHLSE